MQSSLQAIGFVILALLPGAIYLAAHERRAGPYRSGPSDRILGVVCASAIFHAVVSWPVYLLLVHGTTIRTSDPWPWWLVWMPVLYVLIPVLVGSAAGRLATRGPKGARPLSGLDDAGTPSERSQDTPDTLVRCRLRSGVWIGGADPYSRSFHESGDAEPDDLHLGRGAAIHPETGVFSVDENGPILTTGQILINAGEIDVIEFVDVASRAVVRQMSGSVGGDLTSRA